MLEHLSSRRRNTVINRRYLGGALVTAASVLLIAAPGESGARESGGASAAESVVDVNGNLHVPENYRREYEYLGSWAVAADQGQGSKDVHVVYASPGAADAYKAGGHFPDGTVLVKEVFQAATAPMTTGTVSHADVLKGWFVMVRDTTGRHAGNRLWGDGWGWSWFDAGNPTRTTSTDYKTNCHVCHVPAQATEWVYVGGYPSLRPEVVR
jgi:Cytochrome P460